jgi:iron(III) transport system substrate-binding protein
MYRLLSSGEESGRRCRRQLRLRGLAFRWRNCLGLPSVVLGLLIGLILISIGCGPAQAPKMVRLYAALDDQTLDALAKAFKDKTGIAVEYVPLAAGQITARVRAERGAPQADVFIGGSVETHDPLGREGLLLQFRSPEAKNIPSRYLDPDGYWHGWYLGILGIVLNSERFGRELAPKGVQKPTTWDDLLDPAWKGHVVSANPTTAGGGYIFLVNQIFRVGEDRAWQYLGALHKNVARYTPTATEPIGLVAAGQAIAGIAWAHDILGSKKRGDPVELIVPLDTGFEIGAVSIIKGGANPDESRAFVDFVLGKEAGRVNVENGLRLSVRADVSPPPGGVILENVRLVQYYRRWAMQNRDRLLGQWADLIK